MIVPKFPETVGYTAPKTKMSPKTGTRPQWGIHRNQPLIFVGDEFVSFQGKKCTTVPLVGPLKALPVKVEFIKQDAKVAEVWASCWVEQFRFWPGWVMDATSMLICCAFCFFWFGSFL